MVVVTGREPSVVTSTFAALAERDVRTQGAVSGGTDAEPLFDQLFELEAEAFVVVEPLRWHGTGPSTAGDDEWLQACVDAARVPHRPRFVWVTARREDDPAIERVQRCGVPYVILCVAPLIRLGGDALADRTVLVPSALPSPAEGVTTPPLVGRAVARAVLDDELVGRVERVGYDGDGAWSQLLAELGARPEVASPWRIHVARLLGRPVLRAEGGAVRMVGLGGQEVEAPGVEEVDSHPPAS